ESTAVTSSHPRRRDHGYDEVSRTTSDTPLGKPSLSRPERRPQTWRTSCFSLAQPESPRLRPWEFLRMPAPAGGQGRRWARLLKGRAQPYRGVGTAFRPEQGGV